MCISTKAMKVLHLLEMNAVAYNIKNSKEDNDL